MPNIMRALLSTVAISGAMATPAFAQSVPPSFDDQLTWLVVGGGIVLVLYFIPSWVAFSRRHPNRWPIFAINLVFGGTGLGWLGSLIWACGAVHKSATGSNGGESGLNLFVNDPVITRVEPTILQANDSVEKLTRLKHLFDAGLISTDEYTALRRPLLVQFVP